MRRILGLLAGLVVLWAGLWGIIALGLATFLPHMGIHTGARQLDGFPTEVNLTLTDLRLTGGASAPALHLHAPLYKPWHISAQMPNLTWQGTAWESGALDAQFRPWGQIALRQAQFASTGLTLKRWGQSAQTPSLTAQLSAANHENAAHITLETGPITGTWGADLQPARARLQADLRLNAPITLRDMAPSIAEITLHHLIIDLPNAQIELGATLRADSAGYAEGQANLRITGLEQVLKALSQAGFITAQAQGLLAQSAQSGSATLPLRLQFGQVWLGFIPLGPAPLWPKP